MYLRDNFISHCRRIYPELSAEYPDAHPYTMSVIMVTSWNKRIDGLKLFEKMAEGARKRYDEIDKEIHLKN